MLKRWIFYLAALLSCAVFWVSHQGWISWLLLLIVLWLPWLSLLLSLLFMLNVHPSYTCARQLTMGVEELLTMSVRSRFPLPPYRCQLTLHHSLTGESRRIKPDMPLPTEHCGLLTVNCRHFYVYDVLGLFRLPLSRLPELRVLVRPTVVPMDAPRELERYLAHAWQPKPGGGFAENHELRLYRPGDSLNQIHWKLTAKTGNLTIREPMIPRQGRILLTVDLVGTADQLDQKLGKLVWMGQHLLEMGLNFELRALTGDGLLALPVTDRQALDAAVDQLLSSSPALEGTAQNTGAAVSWHFHIGGEQDEI